MGASSSSDAVTEYIAADRGTTTWLGLACLRGHLHEIAQPRRRQRLVPPVRYRLRRRDHRLRSHKEALKPFLRDEPVFPLRVIVLEQSELGIDRIQAELVWILHVARFQGTLIRSRHFWSGLARIDTEIDGPVGSASRSGILHVDEAVVLAQDISASATKTKGETDQRIHLRKRACSEKIANSMKTHVVKRGSQVAFLPAGMI